MISGMQTQVAVVRREYVLDAEGFSVSQSIPVMEAKAEVELKKANEFWANLAAWSEVDAIFRIRRKPGVEIDSSMLLIAPDGEYNVTSVDSIKGRGMYIEIMAKRISPSEGA
jgi:head-tail adaptor